MSIDFAMISQPPRLSGEGRGGGGRENIDRSTHTCPPSVSPSILGDQRSQTAAFLPFGLACVALGGDRPAEVPKRKRTRKIQDQASGGLSPLLGRPCGQHLVRCRQTCPRLQPGSSGIMGQPSWGSIRNQETREVGSLDCGVSACWKKSFSFFFFCFSFFFSLPFLDDFPVTVSWRGSMRNVAAIWTRGREPQHRVVAMVG